ncbi:unnamed protein product [Phytophthora lilii]|uniref:Unnamed protein product n=1 Tax=Phytophthora lilii TaxID=2077276 RepID=A0A9W6X085_9STRA|nr:unnamed protein product [Phytophthora lilii]
METWLTDPNELKRIEKRSQKRSRDRMRALKEWYVPATSGPFEEVQPVFVEAMNQEQSNQEHPARPRKHLVKLLLSKEAAALKEEEDREAMEAVLHRQLSAFTTKLEYLEHVADPVTPVLTRAKTRAGPRRRRRLAREDMHLAPLGPAHSNLNAAKSLADLPSYYTQREHVKLISSASLQLLRGMSRGFTTEENKLDALDDAEVEEYLTCHRKGAKQVYAAQKLQAVWRMFRRRRVYLRWRQRRTRQRRAIFEIWVMTYRVGYRAQRSLLRKYFAAWHADVIEALQLREMELQLFRQAATQTELPRMVLNLVFTSDWEDERAKRMAAKAAEAAKAKQNLTQASSKAAFLGAFLKSAFADVESPTDKNRSRVHRLRTQHIAAREEVRKKVVQHVFHLWKRVHKAKKRVGLNAQLCLKRAVRMAFGTRQRWPGETLLSVFEIWSRWATFNRCRRLGLPLPRFQQSNPHWDIWLHNYQERQVRCVKAAAKAPAARLRRFFLRFHAFAQREKRDRHTLAVASEHYSKTLRWNVLVQWREAIAGSAADKKLTRGVLLRFHRYACAKRKLRPLKLALCQRQRDWLSRRAWRAWKRVQLHTCFKRELNLSRLENSPAWRSRLHRTIDIWRDDRDSLVVCRAFKAWTHFVRKRKLFLTLRMLCARQQRRNLLFNVFNAWKAAKWDRVDGFLEDRLRLDAWDAYRELSVFFPMLFYGSFSDAGSIFGGLPSHTYGENASLQHMKPQDQQELLLATCGDAVRHFHGVLVRDSVIEVRNAILQSRHLVNAIDDASGNTALHVAAQIEEPDRRLEILSLLLSEGASTLRRVNRHGLSPIQLAPDADSRYLLEEGIFAYHSHRILTRDLVTEECESSQRLLWCMMTLMTREWGTGLRIPADVRTGQWHSTLREELWLRQTRIRFSPYSLFAAAVNRSRGFLNALKTRICVSHHDFMLIGQPRKMKGSIADPKQTRELQYQDWEKRTMARKTRSSETGEYEAYARYILASTLDTEACELSLIPSFVGLLFSLNFSSDVVLKQAYRYEEECTAAEGELWNLYQRIQHAEKAWSALLSNPDKAVTRNDVGMLRLFSDDADADLYFRREIFLLEFEQFVSSNDGKSKDGLNLQQEALALEIDSLLIRTQRKFRKAEKKAKRAQDQIDESEQAYRQALFSTPRIVENICVTRMTLEHAHLRMAMALIKHGDMKAVVARLEQAKQILQSEAQWSRTRHCGNANLHDASPPWAARFTFEERKESLEGERVRYSRIFQTTVILEETRDAAKLSIADSTNAQEATAEGLPEILHKLQKEAESKLHTLFMLNLFRLCCCWLAENMMASEEAENVTDSESENDNENDETALYTEGISRNSVGLTRLLSAAGAIFNEATTRRRSSLKNTRRVLETYHRGCTITDLLDPDNEAMSATYAASAGLLFEEERRAAQEAERDLLITKRVEIVSAISERNPVTGQLETHPKHIVDINSISDSEPAVVEPAVETYVVPRNRKKEELQRAMIHRRLQHKRSDNSESDSDDSTDSQQDILPEIHGTELHFGNFVADARVWSEEEHSREQRSINTSSSTKEINDSATAEAMWKRGGVKLADGTAPSIKEVLAQAHRLSATRERLRPGSRRQGIISQVLPELSLPEATIPEAQTAPSPQATDRLSPLRSGNTSPVNQHDKPTRRNSMVASCRVLGRSASMSCLLPGTTPSLTSSGPGTISDLLLKIKPQPSFRDGKDQDFQQTQNPVEHLVVPAIQVKTHCRQNSANSVRSERPSHPEDSSSIVADSVHTEEHLVKMDETALKSKCRTEASSEDYHDDEHVVNDECNDDAEGLEVDVLESIIQSPIVEINTSGDGRSPHSLPNNEMRLLPSGSLVNSVKAYIKWEETSALEAFPLAVLPNNLSGSTFIRDKHDRDKESSLARASSIRAAKPKAQTGEVDEYSAMKFMLDEFTDNGHLLEVENESEVFALQGKTVAMAAKKKRVLRKNRSIGKSEVSEQNKPLRETKERHAASVSDDLYLASLENAPLIRSISVTVVTKPAKRNTEVPEPIVPPTISLTPEASPEKLNPPSPKPFVKLERMDATLKDQDETSSLKLEGMGLTVNESSKEGVVSVKKDKNNDTKIIKTSPSKMSSARSFRAPARHNGKRSPPETISSSFDELSLQGARLVVPEVKGLEKPLELTGFEGMAPLSKAKKEQLWQDFAATPLSSTVQEAYTILYPQTYSIPAPLDAANVQVAQMPSKTCVTRRTTSQDVSMSTAASAPSSVSLRVDSRRQPLQTAIELDRKFWSAVAGYRAIGTSSLVPLDAATIAQRRQDKAQAIYNEFFQGQRANGSSGDHRGLALAWLDMYPKEVADVRKQLSTAPKGLFDELQRTAELQISAALARQHVDEAVH